MVKLMEERKIEGGKEREEGGRKKGRKEERKERERNEYFHLMSSLSTNPLAPGLKIQNNCLARNCQSFSMMNFASLTRNYV